MSGSTRAFPPANRDFSFATLSNWFVGRGGIALLLTLGSGAVLIANSRLPSIVDLFAGIDPALLGLALLASTLTIVAKAARWQMLFPVLQRPSLGLATAGIAVGQVVNWALPTRLGEVVRVGLVNPSDGRHNTHRLGQGVGISVGVLIVEKVLDVAMLLATVAVLIVLAGLPDWFHPVGLMLTGLLGLAAVGVGLVVRQGRLASVRTWARGVLVRLLPARLRQLEDPIGAVAIGLSAWWSRGIVARVLMWSVLAWVFGGVANVLVLRGLDVQLPQTAFAGATLAILAALYGGAALPALPGRLGVFQSLAVLALLPFGVSFDQALAVSVALYGVVYLPPLVLGLLAVVLVRGRASSVIC